MTYRKEIKNISNAKLIESIMSFGCNPRYKECWSIAIEELKVRLGVRKEEASEAIAYFKHGLSHDLFSKDMIKIAETSLKALKKMMEEDYA